VSVLRRVVSEFLARRDRCIVSSRRAMSERVTSGPEGTSNANTVQATIKPPAMQAKANMAPQMIGACGRQLSLELVSSQNQKQCRRAHHLNRRSFDGIGFATSTFLDRGHLSGDRSGSSLLTTGVGIERLLIRIARACLYSPRPWACQSSILHTLSMTG
jgi:hypothetical protein